MNESNPSDQELAELLTLTVSVNWMGTTIYRNNLGQKHRIYGPASITPAGNQYWYQNGLRHRTDGPAAIWAGEQSWWLNGQRHRTDGPAVVDNNGYREWWLNGRHLTEEKWNERAKSI